MIALFGNLDCNVAYLRKLFGVGIAAAGGGVKVKGDDQNAVELAAATIELLLEKSATKRISISPPSASRTTARTRSTS